MSVSDIDHWKPKQSKSEINKREIFGQEFKTIRHSLGMSISGMARHLNVSEELIERIEEGFVSPETPGLKQKLSKMTNRKKLVIA